MKISIDAQIFDKFPAYRRYVIIVRGAENGRQHHAVKKMLAEVGIFLKHTTPESLKSDNRIGAWLNAFNALGWNTETFPPSVYALALHALENIAAGMPALGYPNTLVALSNYISLKHRVPSGVDDLGMVLGDFGLRPAKGNEIFVGFSSNQVEHPEPGEFILADKRRAMCRYWVWRQGAHTSVTPYTQNAAVNIDILPPITAEEGRQIAGELAELIRQFTGASTEIYTLDKTHNVVEIETPPSTYEETVYDILELRGYIQQTSNRLEVRRLLQEGTTIYQGFDPTRPSLHVGHLMSLMVFHYLQNAGNRMIFIVGGGTAQIGDPSGRSKGRNMITTEEVARNAEAVKAQVQKMGLIDFNGRTALMLDNSQWLHMDMLEFAREVTPYFSVNAMIKREDFRKRLDENINLSLFEFIYTALQGYDFLYLYENYDCKIQMGGNDQWMNIIDGMGLISRKIGGTAYAMTFPLLTDRSGKKMGKTAEGGTVWLASEGPYSTSPFDFYQYWVNSPDEDLERNFKLFTFLPLDEIDEILQGHPREAQHRLAFEVTKIVHGEATARAVQADARRAFGGAQGLPENVPTVTVVPQDLIAGKSIVDILVAAGVKSRSEARRLIKQRGVVLNAQRLEAEDMRRLLTEEDFQHREGQKIALVRFGKGKIVKVVLNE